MTEQFSATITPAGGLLRKDGLMLKEKSIPLFLFLVLFSLAVQAEPASKTASDPKSVPAFLEEEDEVGMEESHKNPLQPRKLLILGSYKNYSEAFTKAKELATKTGFFFSTGDMVYDERRGLIYPDDYPDDIVAGAYVARRYNRCSNDHKECITVEKSEGYEGLTTNLYIVLGGIFKKEQTAKAVLARVKPIVPDAYLKNVKIDFSPIH